MKETPIDDIVPGPRQPKGRGHTFTVKRKMEFEGWLMAAYVKVGKAEELWRLCHPDDTKLNSAFLDKLERVREELADIMTAGFIDD